MVKLVTLLVVIIYVTFPYYLRFCCVLFQFTGDFYMTKHSNLAEVHAVFHLVTDDNLSMMTINSRHPIMIGVRNVMMAASRHNITNVIIPLLLVHEMGEVTVMCVESRKVSPKEISNFLGVIFPGKIF